MRVNVVDGWWPKLCYPYLICGAASCNLVDVRDGRVLASHPGPGLYPAGWLPDGRYVVSREPGGDNNSRREVALVAPATAKLWPAGTGPFDWSPAFYVGGPLTVYDGCLYYGDYSEGHPGLWRGTLDGAQWTCLTPGVRVLGQSLRATNGRLCVAAHVGWPSDRAEDYAIWIFEGTTRVAVLPMDNIVIAGPRDWHGTGYYGPARLVKAGTPPFFRDITVTPNKQEGVPLLTLVEGVEWAATATADDDSGRASVILRPAGDIQVIQLKNFEAAYIDVALVPPTTDTPVSRLVIAGNNTKGALTVEQADLTAARKPFDDEGGPVFTPLPVDNPNEHPITGPVDVLPYIVGDETDWPADSGNNGVMHCFWEQWGDKGEGRAIFQKNVETGKSFEVWDFLTDWVRHRRDRIGEPRGEYYEFSDGRWVPRFVTPAMIGTAVVSSPLNKIRFGHADGSLDDWAPFPYEMRIQICTEERLVFHYDPAPGGGNYEVYECYRNRGWRRWWAVMHGTNRITHATEWMSNADPSRRKRPVGYVPDPRIPLDRPNQQPVKATISEPRFPVEGSAPLAVRCVAKVTQGEAKSFRWQRRSVNLAEWRDEHTVPVPANDTDHTFRFDTPGTYEIRLITAGTDGSEDRTGSSRRVIVRAS